MKRLNVLIVYLVVTVVGVAKADNPGQNDFKRMDTVGKYILGEEQIPETLDGWISMLDSVMTDYEKEFLKTFKNENIYFSDVLKFENNILERACIYYGYSALIPREIGLRIKIKHRPFNCWEMYWMILKAYIKHLNNEDYREIYDYEQPKNIEELQRLFDSGAWDTKISYQNYVDSKIEYLLGKDDGNSHTALYNNLYTEFDSVLLYREIANVIKEADELYSQKKEVDIRKLLDEKKEREIKDNIKANEEYKILVVADTINGVYIPTDLVDACCELDKILDDSTKDEIIKLGKGLGASTHFQLGMWIRNNWGLWGTSRLEACLRKKGYSDPDEMSEYILNCYQFWLEIKDKSDN